MNAREFHNNLRILIGIDRYEVDWMTDDQWLRFREDPYRFCITASTADYDRIWEAVENRQPAVENPLGMAVVFSEEIPSDTIELRYQNGHIDRFTLVTK